MAQIYQHNNNYKSAEKKYKQVLKSNPEYEMVFNAKMNLAQSLESGSRHSDKMRKQLLKMTKDNKNKEYLDQIYFTLAEMEMNKSDTLSAINNYTLSCVNSVTNTSQKAVSFLALAKIDFNRALYKSAKTHYDSTLFYMPDDFRGYEQAKEKHEILEKLVLHLDIINMQDSLQFLANLPKAELYFAAFIEPLEGEEPEFIYGYVNSNKNSKLFNFNNKSFYSLSDGIAYFDNKKNSCEC